MSPFDGSLLAVAASQNFGLKGGGRVYIVQLEGSREGQIIRVFDFRDGVFDLAWSEIDRGVLVAGGGDGKVFLMNFESGTVEVAGCGHSREISSVDWSPLRQDKFVTTSWDGTVKLSGSAKAIRIGSVVNEARWSPRQANIFSTVSSDRTARIWDDRSVQACSAVIVGGPDVTDFLSLDWNKYDEWNLVTATPTDLLFWDLRSLSRGPIYRIPGAHRRAIKRVRFSPWQGMKLASVGFDMSLRSWDLTALNPRGPLFDGYSEFTTGLDWSLFDRNKLFSCSWDEGIRCHQLPQ